MDIRTAIYRYCNYQERSHQDVKNKLYELKASVVEANALMVELIEQDLLNEERFARAYVRGKFRIKRWGKRKIMSGLKAKSISDYCIRKGMEEIDPEQYVDNLAHEARKAWERYRNEKIAWQRIAKAKQLLTAHGYESDLISDALQEIQAS